MELTDHVYMHIIHTVLDNLFNLIGLISYLCLDILLLVFSEANYREDKYSLVPGMTRLTSYLREMSSILDVDYSNLDCCYEIRDYDWTIH